MPPTTALPGLPAITIASWSGRVMPEHELQAALAFIAHKLKRPVQLQAYPGSHQYCADIVNVYVCTDEACEAPRNVETVTLADKEHALEPEQRFFPGNPIRGEGISDDNGCLLAKVDHNCITFVVEFTASDNEAGQAILAYVLEKAIPLLDFEVSELLSQDRERMLDAFRQFHLSALQRHIQDKSSALRQLEYDAEDHYRRLVQVERQRPIVQAELDALQEYAKTDKDETMAKQAGELCSLVASGQYEEITPKPDGSIHARTSSVTIFHDDWEFSLGCYDIKVDPAGKVTIHSADGNEADGYPHPHVDSSGRPCLGNIAPDLARAIGRMRIAEALSLIREFLNSYNPDNPYIKISRFDPDCPGEEDDDPCEDCEERCTPYCIMDCEHNEMGSYSCSDCCDYRTDFCYGECERNRGFDYVHPCHDCEEGKDYCFLECRWNHDWALSNPCEECENDSCDDECEYSEKREELNFQKGGPRERTEQPQQADAAEPAGAAAE